ncbi:MAG: hypothetical protein WBO70_05255, partial [Erysipelotrichaceae bacterium]
TAEKLINDFNENSDYSINEILEFYQIKLFFDNKCFLKSWGEETIVDYREIVQKMKVKIYLFFNNLNDDNILTIFNDVEFVFRKSFFEMFINCKLYNKISIDVFSNILKNKVNISYVITNEELVNKYDTIISECLNDNIISAERIISYYFEEKNNTVRFYLPNCLDINDLFDKYIDYYYVNPNYLRLIFDSTTKDKLIIDDKIKLKAKRRYYNEINKLIDNRNLALHETYHIYLSNDLNKEFEYRFEQNEIHLYYNVNWFNSNLDYETILIYNFIHIFEFVDKQIRFSITKNNESSYSLLDMLEIRGRDNYSTNMYFSMMQTTESLKIQMYVDYLYSKHIQIEQIFKWFFEIYINNEFNVNGFYFNACPADSSNLVKLRFSIPELENILRQFKFWCEDKAIDQELINITSDMVIIKDMPSLTSKKYAYIKSKEFSIACNLLCSHQSDIIYISDEYQYCDNFYAFINKYNLRITDFNDYQKNHLLWLIEKGYIIEDENKILRYDFDLAFVVIELYNNDVISYHHVNHKIKDVIDRLVCNDLLEFENRLFTRPESEYLNFVLNKKEFSNGFNIRNKYTHGTQNNDEKTQSSEYYIFLITMILIILKINDEFCLSCELGTQI